jgi:tetratricopeptide (TPR) repeat protein
MNRFPLRSLVFTVAATAGLLVGQAAHAITCNEIVNMAGVNVPSSIIVQTIQSSGTRFSPEDLACLANASMPPDVMAAAQAQAAAVAPPPPQPGLPPQPGVGQPAPQPTGPLMPGLGDETFGNDIPIGMDEPVTTTGNDPAVLEQLIDMQRAKKNLSASKGLFDLLEQNKYPEFNTKIQFYLAKSLYDLEMYHSAQHYFMQVVRRGPNNPYFKYALPRLVAVAEFTGNDAELLRIVHKVPPESFPRQARDHLHYLLGRKNFEKGNLSDAVAQFQQVSAKSELYLRSKYYEGVILNEQKKLRSSVAAFREVVQAKVELRSNDAEHVQEIEDLKDLAIMNIARVYFGLERMENAENYYALVDRESSYWADSVFERAWANFHLLDLNETLGLVLTANSPYFSEYEFNPELTILRALTYWSLCDYDEVERLLIGFEREITPMERELDAFIGQYRTEQGKDLLDKAFDAYFVEGTARSILPPALFHRILRNRDLAALIQHMDMMDEEIASIDSQKPVWAQSLGDSLKKQIAKDRMRYKQLAGRRMLQEMVRQHAQLRDLLGQSEIIRFEVVDAQRKDYEFKTGNVDLEQVDERQVDFATNPEIVYWPFNGEFWKDELGYYRYTEEPQCN